MNVAWVRRQRHYGTKLRSNTDAYHDTIQVNKLNVKGIVSIKGIRSSSTGSSEGQSFSMSDIPQGCMYTPSDAVIGKNIHLQNVGLYLTYGITYTYRFLIMPSRRR